MQIDDSFYFSLLFYESSVLGFLLNDYCMCVGFCCLIISNRTQEYKNENRLHCQTTPN